MIGTSKPAGTTLLAFCALVFSLAALIDTSAAVGAEGDLCPNAALRAEGPSAALPDCRAYELVTPVDKNGGDVLGTAMMNRSSDSGNALMFGSATGIGDSGGSGVAGLVQYVAVRAPGGWVSKGITPTPSPNVGQLFFGSTLVWNLSGELDRAVIEGDRLPGGSNPVPNQFDNLYVESTATRQLETVTTFLGTEEPANPFAMTGSYKGSSSDLGVVAYETRLNMLPGLTGSDMKLYEFDHGTVTVAGILPDGSQPAGGSSGVRPTNSEIKDGVSTDGSRIFFMSPVDGSSAPQLYVRKDGASTVWISQSEVTPPVAEPRNVRFQAASPDGRKVLFTTTDRLTGSDPGGEGYGLYLYSDSPSPETESNLKFIARISEAEREWYSDSGGAIWGMSDDGGRIYFSSAPEAGLPGQGGLYLWEDEQLRRIAPVADGEAPRISQDGRFLSFFSNGALTSQAIDERAMYLYDADTGSTTCASCPSSGAAATAPVEAAPDATSAGIQFGFSARRRFLSSDGHYAFFTTADALVSGDTNKLPDVYEYNTQTGQVSLLSSGTGNAGSWFAEASPSGNDVFMLTRQQMTGWDIDKLVDVYDMRVGGGYPEPPQPRVPCEGDECQGTPSAPPAFNTNSTFAGLGNVLQQRATVAHKRRASTPRALARALKRCGKRPKHARLMCEKRARQKYSRTGQRASHHIGR
jgi:hypothetical protein